MSTFFWYDLETTGTEPRWDRIVQFAGVRTDTDLAVIEAPLVSLCRLADDVLPEPKAALVTGITPDALTDAPNEADLLRRVHTAFSVPNTCVAGFNSLRFDDEFIRFAFWRNFHDPYAREWQNGNSRWDLMDLVRAAGALRPDGMHWPLHDDGLPRYALEALAAANGVEHGQAHDALSDVMATIGIARCVRHAQPRLFEHYLKLRNRTFAATELGGPLEKVVLHVSGRLPRAQRGCALITALGEHPVNRSARVVFDLDQDPEMLAGLAPEEIRERMYASGDDLPFERPRLKQVRLNRVPFLAPPAVLRDAPAADCLVSLPVARRRLDWLRSHPEVVDAAVAAVVDENHRPADAPPPDPDAALYDGFIDAADRELCQRITLCSPAELAAWQPPFSDARLAPLLLRYRARNWPETLNEADRTRWQAFVRERLADPRRGLAAFRDNWRVQADEVGASHPVLASLAAHAERLARQYGIDA